LVGDDRSPWERWCDQFEKLDVRHALAEPTIRQITLT
jgi:hypothetical protein